MNYSFLKAHLFLLSFLWIGLISESAFALRLSNVTGVSYLDSTTTAGSSATAITAYGGIAGGCTGSSNATCDSCTGTSYKSCNPVSVHSALQIGITVVAEKAYQNAVIHVYSSTNPTTFNNDTELGSATITAANGATFSVPVSFTWGNVCASDANFGNSNCTPAVAVSGTGTTFQSGRRIYIWVDDNANGTAESGEYTSFPINLHYLNSAVSTTYDAQTFCPTSSTTGYGQCGFKLTVGDEKVYINELYGTSTALSSVPAWYGVAFFYTQGTSSSAVTLDSSFVVRKISDDGTLSDNQITGLQNYSKYCFVMGNVNMAQNIFLYSVNGGPPASQVCATPSEVVGMLDDKHCFISTAAFGSDMAAEVQQFRHFRNKYLLSHDWGRFFVKAYYKLSPPIANFISQSEVLRSIARSVLYPVYYFTLAVDRYGLIETLFAMAVLVVLSQQIVKRLKARHV